MAIGFLESPSSAVSTWSSSEACGVLTLVGVEESFHLFNEDLEIIDTGIVPHNATPNRLVPMAEHSSFFYGATDGSVGFLTVAGDAVGKLECSFASDRISGESAVDSDIHRSGHLAAVLFNGADRDGFALLDPTRGSKVGKVPLGATGTPNGLRVVDSSQIAVASAIVSLFDVRTPQSKKGIPAQVLEAPDTAGRCFTCVDSDGLNFLIAGDSSGGVHFWDVRSPAAPLKAVHAHSAAVLSLSFQAGLLASSSADGSISLWTVVDPAKVNPHKKSRRHLLSELGAADSTSLKRCAVEGSGAALGVSIENSSHSLSDRHVAYVTDTGVVALARYSDWQ